MTWLLTTWAFVKKYWQIGLLVLGVIVGFILFRGQGSDYAKRLKEIQDAHDDEIKQINAARAEEERQHDLDVKRLQDALSAVQAQYDAAKKDLDDKKKKEIEDIVKQYGSNPNELAKQLSAATGFQIVLPA
jgi:uncharacterized membrane protein (DUF106 family)